MEPRASGTGFRLATQYSCISQLSSCARHTSGRSICQAENDGDGYYLEARRGDSGEIQMAADGQGMGVVDPLGAAVSKVVRATQALSRVRLSKQLTHLTERSIAKSQTLQYPSTSARIRAHTPSENDVDTAASVAGSQQTHSALEYISLRQDDGKRWRRRIWSTQH